MPGGALLPLGGVDEGAVAEVVEEDVALVDGEVGVVEEGVDFEVLLEAAGVDVGGADGDEVVVADHGFGVEVAFVVHVDFDACGEEVAEVGL